MVRYQLGTQAGEEMDGYFNQAEESLSFMATDMNVQTTIGRYVWGTYKERLDLGDFLRNRLANMSTVGRRTGAISILRLGTGDGGRRGRSHTHSGRFYLFAEI